MIFHKWNTKMKVFHKNQKKLESDAIIIDQENLSIVICVIPQGQLDCHRRWIEKGKWDTFFPRTLKNSMHPWVYSTRYAGRGKLAGDKIIPLAPLQIKEQSSWNSSLWEEREISHISYSLPPPLPLFYASYGTTYVAIHLHDASKIDENAGNISEGRFQVEKLGRGGGEEISNRLRVLFGNSRFKCRGTIVKYIFWFTIRWFALFVYFSLRTVCSS